MSVNPGFSGQKFIENTYARIKEIQEIVIDADKEIIVEIDGGINNENAPSLVEAGANMLVAGNYVFNSINPSKAIQSLKNL